MIVSVFGGTNRQLPDLLRACGAQVTAAEIDNLKALAEPHVRPPDVVVVDARDLIVMPAELAVIKRQHPATGIVVVLPRLDAGLVLDAMRSGASECVAEPVTQEDLASALARIASHRPSRRGDAVAVIGAKGGVGATTVAVNVGTMLNKMHPASTLLMDLHLTYGDAAIFLGAEPRFSTLDALENMHRMDGSFLRTLVTQTKSGLNLLASSDHAVTSPVDVTRVRSLIDLAAHEYRFLVLDVPRADPAVLDSLESVSRVVVVANQDVATIRSAARLATALEQRYGKELVSVVISRYDARADIGQGDVERVIGRPVAGLFPNNYPTALASLNEGRPLVLANHTKLASAFTEFARDLAGVPATRPERAKSTGFLSLIGGRR